MDNSDFRDVDFVSGKSVVRTILLVLLVILILGTGVLYYYINIRPIKVFESFIREVQKNAFTNANQEYFDLSVNFEFLGENKEVKSILNKFSLNTKGEMNYKDNIIDMDMSLNYNNKDVLLMGLYYKNTDLYLDLNDLYDKLIKIDLLGEDEEVNNIIKNFSVEDYSIFLYEKLNAYKYALSECDFSKDRIKLNGEYVYKNTLTLTSNNYKTFIDKADEYINNSDRAIGAYERITGKKLEEDEELKTKSNLKHNIIISVYTKGIKNEIVKFDVYNGNEEVISLLIDEENKYNLIINDEDTSFDLNISKGEGKNIVSGSIVTEDLKMDLLSEDGPSVTRIEAPDIDNAIRSDLITEESLENISMKLFEKEGVLDLYNQLMNLISKYYINVEEEVNL